jgi:hypothetical protein
MKTSKIVTVTALSVVLWLTCAIAFAQSYEYDAPVVLVGVLISSTADSAITYDEKPHLFPALKLKKPISVLCSSKDTVVSTFLCKFFLIQYIKKGQIFSHFSYRV